MLGMLSRLPQGSEGLLEVRDLLRQKLLSSLQLLVFRDCAQIDVSHLFKSCLQLGQTRPFVLKIELALGRQFARVLQKANGVFFQNPLF